MSVLASIVSHVFHDLLPIVRGHVDRTVEKVEEHVEAAVTRVEDATVDLLNLVEQSPRARLQIRQTLASYRAAHKLETGEDLDWENSIVDLLKLVGVDSSLANRRRLASEFRYDRPFTGSATDNTWLSERVLRWLDVGH